MKTGDTISVSQLSGNFVLPKDKTRKLAFIAGGIGITPFRSMTQYMIDSKDVRPTILLYSNRAVKEIAYKELFDRAQKIGMKTIYAVTGEQTSLPWIYNGSLTPDIIKKTIPDYMERIFYLSGPRGMVKSFELSLKQMGIPRRRIKIDFFPGFA